MIPIIDRHLRDACGHAIEQEIVELTSRPCAHCFSETFHESIQQMQEKTTQKRTAKFSVLRSRPFRKFLPAAAIIALICLAGYRLLDLVPFRMGSAGRNYSEKAEETSGPDFAAGAEDGGEYTMETETAEAAKETAPDSEEVPGGAMAGESAGEEDGYPDVSSETKIFRENGDETDGGALPESADSKDDSVSRKESGMNNEEHSKNKTQNGAVQLLSVAYHDSTRTLELELQNDSDETIDLENTWMLFNADGDTVNINTASPELANPTELRPQETSSIRCILPDGALPDGEYTLELNDEEHTLTFVLP